MCTQRKSAVFSGFRSFLNGSVSRLAQDIRSFSRDARGNFAVTFSLAAVPILGFTGLAIEFSRYSMVNEGVTNSLDAAGLAISQRASANGWDIANLTNEQKQELKEYGQNFFDSNFKTSARIKNFATDFVFTATTVKPQAQGYMETSLLKLIGVDTFDLNTDSEITLKGAGRLELALVLDVTGSMDFDASGGGGDSRMDVLQDAVEDMMDVLYGADDDAENENVKVGIIPFNTTVNTGGFDQMEDDWLDLDAESMYHGANLIHIENPFDIDASVKVNHFKLFDSIGSETSWKGCVENRPFPLDEFDVAPGTSDVPMSLINSYDDLPADIDDSVYSFVADAFNNAPNLLFSASTIGEAENTKFVPYFYPDEPDCYYSCEYNVFSSTYPTVSDTSWPGYMFDRINEDGDDEDGYYNKYFITDYRYTSILYGSLTAFTNYLSVVCQYRYNVDSTQTHLCGLLPLFDDDDWDAIVAKTQAYDSGRHEYRLRLAYTGIYNPTTETYEGKYDLPALVSESGETAGRGPNYYCSTPILPLSTSKSDIMATVNALNPSGSTNTSIGAIWGWRVLSPEAPFTEGVDPAVETDWRKAVVLMTDGQNSFATVSDHHMNSRYNPFGYFWEDRWNVGTDDEDFEEEANRKTIRICQRMQEEGIRVYTVGFSISSGTDADNMLKACATVPTGEKKTYFLASDADELNQAFQTITEDLVNLHISR